jgi:hypothetical protein
MAVYLFDDWFGELDAALMRPQYGRRSHSGRRAG